VRSGFVPATKAAVFKAFRAMGFLRVSMTPAFGAAFADAMKALEAIVGVRGHRFVRDGTRASALPSLASCKDVTDAHLVHPARPEVTPRVQLLLSEPASADILNCL
jgi:hypothetical protein